jgi:T3SS (YopN, CesT) and YbjN peptide-binding chaperone 1
MQRIIDQVAGILANSSAPFGTRDDGKGYRVLHGSTAVFIDFSSYHDDVAVNMNAPILVRMKVDGKKKAAVLDTVNKLNCGAEFGRFCFYEDVGSIVIEYDLLGSTMDGAEFMNGLAMCAVQADSLDDELRQTFKTGERARDAIVGEKAIEA